MLLENKTIIVTGGTKGIGRAVAIGAAKAGANVVLGGRDITAGEALVKEIEALNAGRAVFVPGDLSDPANCAKLADTAVEKFGKLDGLVNYAGTVQASAPLTTVTEEQFDWIMGVNFKSTFFMTQAALNAMLKTGGGSI